MIRRLVATLVAVAVIIPGTVSADAEDAFVRGVKLARQRNYKKALAAFEEAIKKDPTQIDAYLNAGNIAKHLKMCREVLLYFRGMLYLSPSDPEARNAKAAMNACEKGSGTLVVKVVSKADGTALNGVEVMLDDGLVGKTPLLDVRLVPGNYRLRLNHPDFEPVSEDVTIKAGEATELTRELKKLLKYGYLEVTTNPEEGVSVYLDEKLVGVTPLKEKLKLETRRYLLRFEKPGFDTWVRYITIQHDVTEKVEAILEAVAPTSK